MLQQALLLAIDWPDLIGKGIPVLMFILWLIHQAVSEMKPKKAAAPARPTRPKPARDAAAAQPKGARQADPEIEQFLKRAAAKRARGDEEIEVLVPQQAERRPPRRPARPRVVVVQPGAEGQRRAAPRAAAAAAAGTAAAASLAKASTPPESPPTPLSAGLKSSLSAGRALRERTSHLGEDVAYADERLAARLHATFDHQVGRLGHVESAGAGDAPEAISPMAANVAKMLSSPEGVQQAIILNEILNRPERW